MLITNNLSALVHPLAIFSIAKNQLVIAIKRPTTANSKFVIINLPLTVISSFVTSDLSSETSLEFYFLASSILAPFKPLSKLLCGVDKELTRNGRHYYAVYVFAKEIEHHPRFDVQKLEQN